MIFNFNFLKLAGLTAALFAASPASCATSDTSTAVSPVSSEPQNDGPTDISVSEDPFTPSLIPSSPIGTDAIEESVDFDPRNGVCTSDELEQLNTYFSTTPNPCAAFKCIEENMLLYKDSIMTRYPSFGSEETIEDLAGVFAGCHCRCPVMKCEVDYMKINGSPKCFKSTLKYCSESNTGFTERCIAAATQMPDVYDLTVDSQAFSKPCQVCTAQPENSGDQVSVGTTPDTNNSIDSVPVGMTQSAGIASLVGGVVVPHTNEPLISAETKHSHVNIYYFSILTASFIFSIALYW